MAKSLGNDDIYIYILYIYTGWWFQPSWKMMEWKSMGRMTTHILWKIKHVGNHKPVYIYTLMYPSFICWNVVEHVGSHALLKIKGTAGTILRRFWGSNIRPPCLLLHQWTHSPYLVLFFLSLWKMMESVGMMTFPRWESHKIPWFQTTWTKSKDVPCRLLLQIKWFPPCSFFSRQRTA